MIARRRLLRLVLQGLVLLCYSCTSDKDLRVAYHADMKSSRNSVHVSMEISGVSSEYLLLYAMGDTSTRPDFRNVNVEFLELGKRADLEAARTPSEHETQKSFMYPTWRIEIPPGTSNVRVTYEVKPGGSAYLMGEELALGHFDSDFALVSGRQLFMIPYQDVREFRVLFSVPEGRDLIAPWAVVRQARTQGDSIDVYYPRVFPTDSVEDLVNGVIALGTFRHSVAEARFGTVRLYTNTAWGEDRHAAIRRKIVDIFERASGYLGVFSDNPYTVILTTKSSDQRSLLATGSGTGYGMEMEPETVARWVQLAEEFLGRWTQYQPDRLGFRQEDAWLAEGIPVYYAIMTAHEAGIIPDLNQYLEDLYLSYNEMCFTLYERVPYSPSNMSSLMKPEYYDFRRVQGLVLTHQLDKAIRQATHGSVDLASYLKRVFKKRHGGSNYSWRASEELIGEFGEAVEQFFTTYIRSERPSNIPYPDGGLRAPQQVTFKQRRDHSDGILSDAPLDTLTLVVTGGTESYLETCGCVSSQAGGISRRAEALKIIRELKGDVLVLDAGNALPSPKNVREIDALTLAEVSTYLTSLRMMGYGVVALADNELYHGLETVERLSRRIGLDLVMSNIELAGIRDAVLLEANGYRIGVIGVYFPRFYLRRTILEDHLERCGIRDPISALKRAVKHLEGRCDLIVAMGRIREPDFRKIVDEVPEIDIIVTLGSETGSTQMVDGKLTRVFSQGDGFLEKTLILGALGKVYGLYQVDLYAHREEGVLGFDKSYIRLDGWMEDNQPMRAFLEAFYDSVTRTSALLEGQIQPLFPWDQVLSSDDRPGFVGSEKCAMCHSMQVQQWRTTSHARAYKTLLDAHRHFYPKCIVCHVVGYGMHDGYKIGDGENDMANVNCEICHGPGADHIASPTRTRIRLKPEERTCLECHNSEHDDDFDYRRDYAAVSH